MPDDQIANVQEEALPGRAFPRFSDDASPAEFGAGLGQGIEQAGEAISIHDRTRVIAANTQLSNWKTQALYTGTDPTQKGADAAFSQQGGNAVALDQKYLPQFDSQADKIASTLTGAQQDAFRQHAMIERSEMQLQLARYENEEAKRTGEIVNQAANSQTIQQGALGWRDPQVVNDARDRLTMQASAEAVRQGFAADSPVAQQLHSSLVGQLHGAVVKQMVDEGAIDQASQYLYKNLGEMDLKQGESLQSMLLNRAAHEQIMANRQLKQGSDELFKDGLDKIENHTLSAQWLHDNRDSLEPERYKYFQDVLSGATEGAGDPRVYADLMVRAANGENVVEDARHALLSRQVTTAQFTGVVKDSEGQAPSWRKRGAEFLNQALDPGQLNPDPAAHQSKAFALQEWSDWAASHPKATDPQAEEQSRVIASHYHMLDQNTTTLLLPAPRYLKGTRAAPDLVATAAATMSAHDKGEISDDEFRQQALLLQQYGPIIKQQNDAAQAAAAKRKANP